MTIFFDKKRKKMITATPILRRRRGNQEAARSTAGPAAQLWGRGAAWVAENCSASMAAFLLDQFKLDPDALYQERGPVNLVRRMQVPDWVDRLAVGEGASARYATIAAPVPYLPNAARIAICASKYRKLRRSVIALHACSIRPTPKSSN
jgi:hypothetical protein